MKRIILLSLFTLAVNYLFSQTFIEQTGISLEGVSFSSVAWGDYNNDGDLDILMAGSTLNGRIAKIYKNNGNNTFTEQTGISLTGVYDGSVAWGDYDNDGYLDILLAGNSGSGAISKIYKNNGNNTFTEQTGISLTGVDNGSVVLIDYDNDGDHDILLTGNYISKIYKNDGYNTFTEQTGISLIAVSSSSVAWGDYDNDGDLDILLTGGSYSGNVSKIYKNNGDNTFTEQKGISLTGVQNSSIAWGDYDNDGDLDILLTGNTGSTRISKIYKNNGNNTFTEQTGISLIGVSDGSVAWGDYDNDGYLDILLTGKSSSGPISKIFKNNGNNTFSEQTGISLPGVSNSSVAWGDFDNDGDLDIILTGGDGSSRISKIYKNENSLVNTCPTPPECTTPIVNKNSVTLSWVKASDGQTSSDGLSYNLYIKKTSENSVVMSSMSDVSTGFRRVVRLGNINQVFTYTVQNLDCGEYEWYIQAVDHCFSGSIFSKGQNFEIFIPSAPTKLAADVISVNEVKLIWMDNSKNETGYVVERSDGDNQNFSVIATLNANCITYNDKGLNIDTHYYYRIKALNNDLTSEYSKEADVKTSLFLDQTGISLTGVSTSSVAWGDYNNDGHLDILLTGYYVSKIFKNNGNNTFTEQIGIPLTGVVNGSAAWGDYDNDGDLDILLTGKINTGYISKIYKNNGNNTFTEQTGISLTPVAYSSVAWGDYDNDGDLDILLTGKESYEKPISKIYKNNGNNNFSEQTGISLIGISDGSVAWGDYDNDGDLDILISGDAGETNITRIYINNGNDSFSLQIGNSFTGVSWSSAAWGDYDNDGDLDILLAGFETYKTYISKIYKNNGDNTFTNQNGISFTGVYKSSVAWGDYDNDGDLDVLLTGFTDSKNISKIYKNNGDNTFTEQTGISLTGVEDGSVDWGDYDNDGDLDILLAGYSGSNYITKIYKNECSTINTSPSAPICSMPIIKRNYVTLSWGKATDSQTPDDGLTYNLYIKKLPEDSLIISPMSDISTGFRKISGLGNKNQALSSSFKLDSGEYEWYVQAIDNCFSGSIFSKGRNFNISNKLTPITLDAIAISVNEIYLSWIHDSNEETGYVVERSAGNNQNFSAIDTLESNSKEYTDKGLQTNTQYFYKIKTIYNDLSTEYSNEVNKLTSPFEEQTSIILPQVSSSSVDWGDYDNDSDLDILLTGSYVSEIFRNDGNNSFTKQTGISLSEITGASVKWGDYNNDENLDILYCGNYMSKLYKNNGDNTLTSQNGISLASVSDCSVDWGDYDNDGDLDILLTGYNSGAFNTSFISKIYKNNGDNTFTDQKEISLPGIRQSSVAWGDYDNDGDLDVLMTGLTNNYTTITKIFKNNGNNTFSEQTGINIPGLTNGSVDWGDYDNDGDLDILLTGYTDSKTRISRIYRNNGNNTFTEQTGISLTGVEDGSVAWGDYDNDGFLDILLAGNPFVNCISKIYKNNRDNTFTEQTTIKLIGVYNGSVAWGDYDSDGDLDILLTGTTGNTNITKIYKNLTANVNTIPSVPADLKETVNGNSVTFNWNRATDKETMQNGLSYNMIIQSILNGKIIKSPMSNHGNGKRKVMRLGNVGQMNAWSIKDLPAGIYSWSIQAIDQSFAGSPFAPTKTFIVGTSTSLDKPTTPIGPVNICINPLNSEYTTTSVPNSTTYNWSISPSNAGIISGNTTTAMVDWSDTYEGTAKISVIAYNTTSNYGISASSDTLIVTINTPPFQSGVINGDQTVCQGTSGHVYKTLSISGAESYIWSLPQGASGTSTSDSIFVSFGESATSGNIKVQGQNSCGVGSENSFAVTVNTKPGKPIATKNGPVLQSSATSGNQWYKQGQLIPGADQKQFTSTGDGQYYVIVTESGCSSEPSDVFTVTGIEMIRCKGLVEIYPNPVSQILSVISVDNGASVNYEFVDLLGKVIQKGNFIGKTIIETGSFIPGVFFLKINNGKTNEIIKIIKE